MVPSTWGEPGGTNVIPGRVTMSVEFRDLSEQTLREQAELITHAQRIGRIVYVSILGSDPASRNAALALFRPGSDT